MQRLNIVEPVHGIVKGLAINTVGGMTPPGGLVSEIVPMDKELIVEARISPVDIGRITIGHKANVRVTTFIYAFRCDRGDCDKVFSLDVQGS